MPPSRFSLIQSPFARLRHLLEGVEPGCAPIDLTIGEPQDGMPDFAARIVNETAGGFSRYPPIGGTKDLRGAIAAWHDRRYPSLAGRIDAERHILPLNGSREGLFSALFTAAARKAVARPAVLMPNPFYQAYLAAALAAQCEPIFLPATSATAFLPDLDQISEDVLARTVAFYMASPANPQGAVASRAYLDRLIGLARAHDFILFADECYSEIYRSAPPPGVLEAAAATGSLSNVLALNSLSKRSSAPGLRSGFIAGDPAFLADYLAFRNVACPQIPLPVQAASAALWSDEAHVEESRKLYRARFDLMSASLGPALAASGHPPLALPDGGFFLWLDLRSFGGGEAAAITIWKECGVKILPGAYLAQTGPDGSNPGAGHARVALVQPLDAAAEAARRLARLM